MTTVFAALIGAGSLLCAVAAVWWWATRHQRRVWKRAQYNTSAAAVLLELEEKVRELEDLSRPPTPVR